MRYFMRVLDRLEETLIATLIALATIIIFIAVTHRYATDFVVTHRTWPGAMASYKFLSGIHLSWAQELCIYMFVWMAKFGAAYGVRTGIHVGVDVLVLALSPKWRKGTILFGLLCGALFTGIIGTMGASFVIGLSQTDQTSPDLELPSWIVYLCIPLGSYLMCFRFLQVAFNYVRSGDLPHHDHSHVEGIDVDPALGPTPEGAR
ncbi:MAG: TRAP transporter small permease [Tardiphaga sp.]|nr:TRAP transporter small permease [Tardiphaga sp.]